MEKYGSILLESDRDGGELPSALKFCHEIAHSGKQSFEHLWLIIFLYCLKNHCLQLLPVLLLTYAGSRYGSRRASTTNHAVLVLLLVRHSRVTSHPSGFVVFKDVVNLLKRLFALTIVQDISSLEKYGSIILEFNRDGGELPSALKFCYEIAHVGKQGFEHL